MPKCDFNKFAAYFQSTLFKNNSGRLLLEVKKSIGAKRKKPKVRNNLYYNY